MKWKQQSGQYRLARANKARNSLNQTYHLVHVVDKQQRPVLRTSYHHTQCHTVSRELMKFIGELFVNSSLEEEINIAHTSAHFSGKKRSKLL
jgi:hypothetical protein